MFWIFLLGLLVAFVAMYFMVKSGRLTVYMVAIDAALIKAEPIFETITTFDFGQIMTAAQQGWLVFTATILAGIARIRGEINKKVSG